MADNMTIGPALMIGGNTAELTTKGKVKITNSRGKVKTLSQDQFKKQLIKNAAKIDRGENFEFKKDNKTAKILGGAVATAAVVTGVIYRKEIAKYMKDFSWKKLVKDIKDLFSAPKKEASKPVAKGETKIGVEYENAAHLNFAREFDAKNAPGSAYMQERTKMIEDAKAAFTPGLKLNV